MSKFRLDIDELKSQYIGYKFNWFTIVDVFRNRHNRIMFKCVCKCGNIRNISKKVALGKHPPISCSCYKQSDEYFAFRKQLYVDQPEISEKISAARKEWCKNNPDKCKEIGKHNSELYDKEPERRAIVGDRVSSWYKDNPDKVKEKSESQSEWYKNNKDSVALATEKRLTYLKEHPDVELARREHISEWGMNNRDRVDQIADKNKQICLDKRKSADYSSLLQIIDQSQVEDLLSGNIKAGCIINTRCPSCGKYAPHKINDVYIISKASLKHDRIPLCQKCYKELTSSHYEDEIEEHISTFYSGEHIRNSRDIISPLELDLYYPEKKIAIEFNGDYWHDINHKPNNYHYNKYKMCKDIGITLVSIFESEWAINKDTILEYIRNLFDGKSHKLSFTKEGYMNNNYPAPMICTEQAVVDDIVEFDGFTVQTCGYSKIVNS